MVPRLPAQAESPARIPLAAGSIPALPTQPRPILQLSVAEQILYVELVATTERQSSCPDLDPKPTAMLWVRPLLLVCLGSAAPGVVELRHTADLLWPEQVFTPAFAEDLLPYLPLAAALPEARQMLQSFMQQVWLLTKMPQPEL
jgi:hypothetical protein